MKDYVSEAQELHCSSPLKSAINVFDKDNRPQPRLERDPKNGYTVSVGNRERMRVESLTFCRVKLHSKSLWLCGFLLGNVSSAMLNAEAAVLKGLSW